MEKMSAVEAPKGGFGTFGGPGRCSRGALATGSVDRKEPPDTPKARKWGFSGLTGANPHLGTSLSKLGLKSEVVKTDSFVANIF